MNNNITLNASMRSNLLSLRNISKQMDKTQLILATGKKVNSAIDNASSYYQARSLSNRAADLTSLLDAMSQGIQTIEAATQGLTSGLEFLEQATAVTMQAASSQSGGVSVLPVPEKEWFIEQVGENGAVVSTAQELRDAITSGKETICVYGAIDLGTITSATALTLKANQKLVGVGYFGNYDTATDKFSSITATATAGTNMININKAGCLVSDLSINYQNTDTNIWIGGIRVRTVEADLNNLDIEVKYSDGNGAGKAAVYAYNGAIINVRGNNNLVAFGKYGHGFFLIGGASCNALENSNINIKTMGDQGRGFTLYNSTNCIIGGNLQIYSSNGYGFYNYPGSTSNNTITIQSTAKVYMDTALTPIYNGYKGTPGANVLDIAAGASLAFAKDGNVKWYKLKTDYHDENTSTNKNNEITFDNVDTLLNVENTAAWSLPEDIIAGVVEVMDLSGYSASCKLSKNIR